MLFALNQFQSLTVGEEGPLQEAGAYFDLHAWETISQEILPKGLRDKAVNRSDTHIGQVIASNASFDACVQHIFESNRIFFEAIGARSIFMEAGPELDALIVERALGFDRNSLPGFKPSTNMNDAMIVAELMPMALDCYLALENCEGEQGRGWAARFEHEAIPEYSIFECEAPHAISLAILVTVGFLSLSRHPANIKEGWVSPRSGLGTIDDLLEHLKYWRRRSLPSGPKGLALLLMGWFDWKQSE